jgi:hypothetical protein
LVTDQFIAVLTGKIAPSDGFQHLEEMEKEKTLSEQLLVVGLIMSFVAVSIAVAPIYVLKWAFVPTKPEACW